MKLYQLGNNENTKTVLHLKEHIDAFEKQGFKCLGECDKYGKLIKEEIEVIKPLEKCNKTELMEICAKENIEVTEGATNAQIVDLIIKARANK